jgi:hypothetical protein
VASYSNGIVGMCVALPQLPLNAVAQFAIIGEQFTIRVLVFALLALLETSVLGGLVGALAYAIKSEIGVVALEIAVLLFLLTEMIVLAVADVSLCMLAYVRLSAWCCRDTAKPDEIIIVNKSNDEREPLIPSTNDVGDQDDDDR